MKNALATKLGSLVFLASLVTTLSMGCAAEPADDDEEQGETSSAIRSYDRAADQCALTPKAGVVEDLPAYGSYGTACRTKAGACYVQAQPICSVCACGSVRGVISSLRGDPILRPL